MQPMCTCSLDAADSLFETVGGSKFDKKMNVIIGRPALDQLAPVFLESRGEDRQNFRFPGRGDPRLVVTGMERDMEMDAG